MDMTPEQLDSEFKLFIVDSCVVVDAFDTSSDWHASAHTFLESARAADCRLVMPMHGVFEVKCAMHRIVHVEKRKVSPPYKAFESALHIIPQPIDHKFMEQYSGVDVPYAKAGDTIYLVMAKRLGLRLVTRDGPMLEKALSCGIRGLTVEQALEFVTADETSHG